MNSHTDPEDCKIFITAIIDQSCTDALSWSRSLFPHTARNFLKSDNKLLKFYCSLIDIDHEYLAERMQKLIIDYDEFRHWEYYQYEKFVFWIDLLTINKKLLLKTKIVILKYFIKEFNKIYKKVKKENLFEKYDLKKIFHEEYV